LFSVKLKFTFIFLNKTIINNPKENSRPANANKKNDKVYKLISSFIQPKYIEIIYKIIHINSEYNNNINKLLEFKKNIKKISQKTLFQKSNQTSKKNIKYSKFLLSINFILVKI